MLVLNSEDIVTDWRHLDLRAELAGPVEDFENFEDSQADSLFAIIAGHFTRNIPSSDFWLILGQIRCR
jgi:hypothetical protein